jgi:predicted dehydrogenase/threonine dehydrogenase-like Zn-dependent dehydrogenase
MKQILYTSKGKVFVADVPAPACGRDEIIVRNEFSLVSAGTERSMVALMKKPLVQMAIERKDLTAQVIKFAKESGVKKTIDLVQSRLDIWHLLGYSCAGTVAAVGENIQSVGIGDKVACAGSGVANHAEFVAVPVNMFVKIPPGVKLEEAAFAGVGAIALQSVRQLEPTLGETHVVLGLGLIGQLVASLLKANGCRVIGIDPDSQKVKAPYLDFGLSTANAREVMKLTNGIGADGVIIAAATKAQIVNDAFDMCRTKGRVVLLGVTGMELDRSKMYEKELSFKISTAFGPGSYDPLYLEKNIAYPVGYVRWTLTRNMEAFLELIRSHSIAVMPLVEKTVAVADAEAAYTEMLEGKVTGLLISYGPRQDYEKDLTVPIAEQSGRGIKVGLIGVGNFAKGFLIPAMKRAGMQVYAVCALDGTGAKKTAEDVGAKYATTDPKKMNKDKDIELIVIATRHDSHAELAIAAMHAGKHVYVEKPGAIFEEEFAKLSAAVYKHRKVYAIGFNRRYSPAIAAVKRELRKDAPIIINYVFNNTFLPDEHWVNQRDVGGGRFIGEACHIIDLFNYLTGSTPTTVTAEKLTVQKGAVNDDNNIVATIKYANGSVGNVVYACIGSAAVDREQCTVIQDGTVIEMHNFTLVMRNGKRLWKGSADLGYEAEMQEIARFLQGEPSSLITSKQSLLATEMVFSIIRCIKGNNS